MMKKYSLMMTVCAAATVLFSGCGDVLPCRDPVVSTADPLTDAQDKVLEQGTPECHREQAVRTAAYNTLKRNGSRGVRGPRASISGDGWAIVLKMVRECYFGETSAEERQKACDQIDNTEFTPGKVTYSFDKEGKA